MSPAKSMLAAAAIIWLSPRQELWYDKTMKTAPVCCCIFFCLLATVLGGCAAGRPLVGGEGPVLQPARYVQYAFRSPDLQPEAARYVVEAFPVDLSQGLSAQEAADLFREELIRAMRANGLQVDAGSPDTVISGRLFRFTVASPLWRFLSGRGQAHIQAGGDIRRGQEILFAFQDTVTINPAVNPRHRPALEPNLMARQAARRLALNILNELLLPPGRQENESHTNRPAATQPTANSQ